MNEEYKAPRNADYDNNVTANNESISTTHRLILPYKGEQGQKIIKSISNYVKRLLPQNHTAQYVYISRAGLCKTGLCIWHKRSNKTGT